MSRTQRFASPLLLAISLIGCIGDEGMDEDGQDVIDDATSEVDSELSAGDTYTPFTGTSTSGPASTYPWKGYNTSYPAEDEDFRGYGLPSTVECSSSKSTRSHLDVTAGCLKAIAIGSYSRGQIEPTSNGAFRAVALPFTGSEKNPLKWTDQSNQVRFHYAGFSGPGVDPGFKLFVRYRTEMDLYVASWREDGLVNIKKKQAGVYKTLAQTTYPKPSTGTWHTMRFDAIGTKLDFYIDGKKVLSTTDSTFSWGTSGIRTDATPNAYLDDWTVR
jgi:hypothetical protein